MTRTIIPCCVVCESRDFQFLFERNNFKIEKCVACSLTQVTNIPPSENIQQTYDQGFFEQYYRGLERSTRKQRYAYLNFHNKLDQIERRIARRGTLLDVGCSFGFFLDAARQRGWAVEGVDVSEHAASYARSRLNLSVKSACITEAHYAERSFDVITMWYVIEHLASPKHVLNRVSDLLKDDGLLVISTPNVDSYLARIQRKRWRIWIPPEHLVYFSPKTITLLFDKCNLNLIDYESAVPYETYLRSMKLYSLVDRLQLSDNVIYYGKKGRLSLTHGDLRPPS